MIQPRYKTPIFTDPFPTKSGSQAKRLQRQPTISGQPANTSQASSASEIEFHSSLSSFDGWQKFEWMPPAYRARRDARPCFHLWSTIVALSIALTFASVAIRRGIKQQSIQRNTELRRAAGPVRLIKHRSEELILKNASLNKWIDSVESAKPNDCMIQLLGDIAAATRQASSNDSFEKVDVQSIEVLLPLQHDTNATDATASVTPHIKVDAFATDMNTVARWKDRLEDISRLENVRVESSPADQDQLQLRMSATPSKKMDLP